MTWVAVAIAGSAVIGAGASIYAGNQAAGATKQGAKDATAAQLYMYDQSRADLAPYRNVGYSALGDLSRLYGWSDPTAAPVGASWAPGTGLSGGAAALPGKSPGFNALDPFNISGNPSRGLLAAATADPILGGLVSGVFGGKAQPYWYDKKTGMIVVNGKKGGRDQIGGTIDPRTGLFTANNDPNNLSDKLNNYLRTGQWEGGGAPPKSVSRFVDAANALRGAGWSYNTGAGNGNTIQPSDLGTGSMTGGPYGGDANTTGAPPAGSTAPGQDLSAFYASPDYQFRLREGINSIGNSYAARGGALSGPSARASVQYAGDLATGEFNNYKNTLMAAAGLGQVSTGQTASLGASTGGNLADIYMNRGANLASTYGAAASGVNNAIQGGLQNWAFMNYLNQKPA
jgi:hypothetical protein